MCEWVEEKDSDGNCLKTKKYKGKYYASIIPGNVKDQLERLENMEVRDDDTFVLSYPKSGTHWVFTIASMLRTGKSSYSGSPHFLDYNEIDLLDNLPSPRLLASHLTFDQLPRQVREGKGKVLLITRNPKDVAVSYHIFMTKLNAPDYKGSWEGFLRFYSEGRMLYGSWFDAFFDWENTKATYKGDNILYLIYEDMKQDLLANVTKIAAFLCETYDKSFLEEVTDRSTFKTMVKTVMEEIKPSDQDYIHQMSDDKKLPIYRKGEVGDWKNHFTVAQNEIFDKIYQEKMKNTNCTFRFE
ncbi:amine sulfotransferase-like [Mizuhopecten yessoensis]|uniref:Cytosolic sulfotransferase 3 n=1 Tax=Mizuhopecten yessoensis TaxID=6573 RepID=A0A210PY74_MIZYE|nr:amine sulfotransferase-like [Mizuhopecten yessoensis]OWF41437.1 Cytosolic sulfotransferase 3 [Mizuhopecten yessoensis]